MQDDRANQQGQADDYYPRAANIAVASSGDPSQDQREIHAFVAREKRLIEGICANGCGPMTRTDAQTRECPACGFVHYSATLSKENAR